MLRQPRPKSQPPPVTFNQANDDDWGKLMVRFNNNDATGKIDASEINNNKELECLSSASSQSSSSSSLASSSLSLSTNSSTSTVLAALNNCRQQQQQNSPPTRNNNNKSMIARYSASAVPANNKRSDLPLHANKQLVAQLAAVEQLATSEEEEEDLGSQHLSSTSSSASSTSSSSSGLSSMNSGSHSSQQETRYCAGGAIASVRSHEDDDDDDDDLEEDDDVIEQVHQCIDQLVGSVVAAQNEQQQQPAPVAYGTFRLHEAMLAKTRSSSSDDDSGSEHRQQLSATGRALQVELAAVRRKQLTAAAHLVKRVQIGGGDANDEAKVLQIARNCLAGQRVASWLVGVRPVERVIEWCSSQPEAGGTASLDQVAMCLIDERLVVWVLRSAAPSGAGKLAGDCKSRSTSGELETTLDDIALALDEPIEPAPEAGAHEALIWWCASMSEAKEFGDIYKELIENCKSYGATEKPGSNVPPATDPCSASEFDITSSPSLAERSTSENSLVGGGGDNSNQRHLNQRQQVKSIESKEVDIGSTSDQTKVADNHAHRVKASGPTIELQQESTARKLQEQQQKIIPAASGATCVAASSPSSLHSTDCKKPPLADEVATPIDTTTTTTNKHVIEIETRTVNHEPTDSKKDKLLRQAIAATTATKSIGGSSTDLIAIGQSNGSTSSSSSPGFASYYKSVASKVLSNGQNKIKNFKDEMIKLNKPSSSSSSSSSAAAKRISMAIQTGGGKSSQQQQQQLSGSSTGSVLNLSLSDSATKLGSCGNEIESASIQRAAAAAGDGHQHRPPVKPSSTGKEQQAAAMGSKSGVPSSGGQAPTIKPRTSILKNRKPQQQNNGCDINNNNSNSNSNDNNNNNDNGYNNRRADLLRAQRNSVSIKQRTIAQDNDGDDGNQCHRGVRCNAATAAGAKSTQLAAVASQALNHTQNTTHTNSKPKSILKSSKSVSNLSAAVHEQQPVVHQPPSKQYRVSSSSAINSASTGNSKVSAMQQTAASSRSDISAHSGQQRRSCVGPAAPDKVGANGAHHYTIRRAPSGATETAYDHRKRRSAHSLAPDTLLYGSQSSDLDREHGDDKRKESSQQVVIETVDDDDLEDDDLEDEQSVMDRQQAFERLRQRASCYDISRLMSKNGLQNQLSKLRAGSTNSIAGKSRQRRPALLLTDDKAECAEGGAMQQVASTGSSGRSSERARGVQSAVSQDIYSGGGQLAQGGRRQLRQMASTESIASCNQVSADESIRSRKSEFDPRSLRRLPVEGKLSSLRADGMRAEYDKMESRQIQAGKANGESGQRPMTSIIRLGSSQQNDAKIEQPKKDNLTSVVSVDNRDKQRAAQQHQQQDHESETDETDETETETDTAAPTSGYLSKGGPFSLLRQSFNQKTLSSMLKFSGRASLRIKSSATAASDATNSSAADGSGSDSKGASAIAIAEANLMAAKQLKQQAQRLKEQQKREQQQMQQQLDPASMMLAAVQYNQHLQRQQQQQQLIYRQQQQYAVAARGQMFDASSMHMQHQMQMQIQRHHHQQQLAYMANLNSTHYMAQQMVMAPNPMAALAGVLPAAQQPQPLMYAPQVQQHPPAQIRKSILKGAKVAALNPEVVYSQQQQQLIPMAVNHHSSFNIVYAGTAHHQMQQQSYTDESGQQQVAVKQKSSLGASMRKTVKSILVNRSAFLSSTSESEMQQQHKQPQVNELKLKSALKSVTAREIALNSEGSDGDGSTSSDSTTVNGGCDISAPSNRSQVSQAPISNSIPPKSALKKALKSQAAKGAGQQQLLASSASSTDSSCSSTSAEGAQSSSCNARQSMHYEKLSSNGGGGGSQLSRGYDHRQSVRLNANSDGKYNGGTIRASKQRDIAGNGGGRKNVTFSAKLTSIL